MDGRALGFTLIISILTGVVCGLIPAWQSRNVSPFDTLKAEGRSATGTKGRIKAQQALVVAEIALSMLLLTGAGLLLRSYLRLQQVNPGFRTERVLTLQLTATASKYPKPRTNQRLFS